MSVIPCHFRLFLSMCAQAEWLRSLERVVCVWGVGGGLRRMHAINSPDDGMAVMLLDRWVSFSNVIENGNGGRPETLRTVMASYSSCQTVPLVSPGSSSVSFEASRFSCFSTRALLLCCTRCWPVGRCCGSFNQFTVLRRAPPSVRLCRSILRRKTSKKEPC